MGVLDKVTDRVSSLLPVRRERQESLARQELPPVGAEVMALRENLDRWLQRFFDEPWGLPGIGEFQLMPSADVHETDADVVVSLEVPGLDKNDIDLTIRGNELIVRGEKREEREETRRDVRISERRYGSFVRRVPLPDDVDTDRAEARVERGVLTVRLPKATARRERRRLPIGP